MNKKIYCTGCGDEKIICTHKGTVTFECIQIFERDGWIYRSGSKGICPTCNLLTLINKGTL